MCVGTLDWKHLAIFDLLVHFVFESYGICPFLLLHGMESEVDAI